MFAVASSWNMYSFPVRFAGSPVHRSFASTPKRDAARAQDVEQRAQRLLEVGLERARRSRATSGTRACAASNVSRPADATNFWRTSEVSPQMFPRRSRWLYIAPSASGASPFDTRPRRAPMISGRCSMPTGHWFSHAPHVVHCHSTPGSYTSASFASIRPASSAVLVLEDQRLRVQQLPGRRRPGSSSGSGRTRRT